MKTKFYRERGNLFPRDMDLSPGRRKSLWETFPALAVMQDPKVGWVDHEEFLKLTADNWTLTQVTGGTFSLATAYGNGVVVASAGGHAADGDGIQAQATAGPFIIPCDGIDHYIEFGGVQVSDADKIDMFVGLAEVDTTLITTAGGLTAANALGWKCVTADGVLLFTGINNTTAATKAAVTLVDGTPGTNYRLGMLIRGKSSVQQYINGVPVGTPLTATNIPPDTKLVPSFVCQTTGAVVTPTLWCDYMRIAAVRTA